jgi:uncharacterized protein YndB with AHSA1/START domain
MSSSTQTHRIIPFSLERIYGAFSDGKTLATWWGPTGFTNEFETFEFKTGGRWKFTMIGPDGHRYANQSLVQELRPAEKVVIRHDCAPYFTLTVRLEPHASGTMLHWEGVFDDPKVFEAVKHIVIPANEQNLDRLTEVLRAKS